MGTIKDTLLDEASESVQDQVTASIYILEALAELTEHNEGITLADFLDTLARSGYQFNKLVDENPASEAYVRHVMGDMGITVEVERGIYQNHVGDE
jgi:hypothetical protein